MKTVGKSAQNSVLATGMICECTGHGGEGEHFDSCGRPTLSDAHLCQRCREGEPLDCWSSTCPAAGLYPHAWTDICSEHSRKSK